jgi:hypothetical protein
MPIRTYGQRPRAPRSRVLNRAAIRASIPIPAMLKNGLVPSIPASIVARLAIEGAVDGNAGVVRTAERRGEAIAGSGGDQSECGAGTHQSRADLVEPCLAAPQRSPVSVIVYGGARELRGVSRTLGEMNGAVKPPPLERLLDQRAPLSGHRASAPAPEMGIDDGNDLHDSLL